MAQGINIESFLRKLAAGDFNGAKRSLGLNLRCQQSVRFASEPLSRHKEPCLTYKCWEVSQSKRPFVVKFSKPLSDDPWYNVDKEYDTLSGFSRKDVVPVPRPLYCSTATERRAVGADFIIMSFVEGINYACASEVPVQYRRAAFSSVMSTVAKLHDYHWVYTVNDRKTEYLDSAPFFQDQAKMWTKNYRAVAVAGSYGRTNQLFSKIQREEKPAGRSTHIIHGDLDVSNIIFDHQHRVKAIVDWKQDKNGDPLCDVANFTMVFLQPEAVSYRFNPLARLELLLGDQRCPSEEEILAVYKRTTRHVFNEGAFNYAKALCCLRWISVVKAAWKDDFQGHECGQYAGVTDNPQLVIDCLTEAGEQFYSKWLSSRTRYRIPL